MTSTTALYSKTSIRTPTYTHVAHKGKQQPFSSLSKSNALEIVRKNGLQLANLPLNFKRDKDVVRIAVNENPDALSCTPFFHDNLSIMITAVKKDYTAYKYASKEIKKNLTFLLETLKSLTAACEAKKSIIWTKKQVTKIVLPLLDHDSLNLRYLHTSLMTHKYILRAVAKNGLAIQYAPEPFKTELSVTVTAVSQNAHAYRYLSRTDKMNLKIALPALRQNPLIFAQMPFELKKDPIFIRELLKEKELMQNEPFLLMLLQENESLLRELPDEVQKNRSFILQGLAKNEKIYFSLPPKLSKDPNFILEMLDLKNIQQDKSIALDILSKWGYFLSKFSPEIKKCPIAVLTAVRNNGDALSSADSLLQGRRGIVLEAVRNKGIALRHASPGLRCDEKTISTAIRKNPEAFLYAHERIRNDRSFILNHLKCNSKLFKYIPAELQNDPKFAKEAVKVNGLVYSYLSPALQEQEEIVWEAICQNSRVIQQTPDRFKKSVPFLERALIKGQLRFNYWFVLHAVQVDGLLLRFAATELQVKNVDICLAALEQNPEAAIYLSHKAQMSILEIMKQEKLYLRLSH